MTTPDAALPSPTAPRPARRPGRRAGLAAAAVTLALATGLLAANTAEAEPRRYVFDPEHLTVGFLVSHIGYAKTLGLFREVEGSFVYDDETRTLSELEITVETGSVDTHHERRDEHVRSADFLDAEAHPEMTFVMTGAEATGETTGTVTGDLALRGETRPLTLDVTLNKIGAYPYGNPPPYVIGVSVRGALDRSDWGMVYGIDSGLVGDRVELLIEAEAQRQE
ncbi:MAG: YceI family protein [Azospirillaceae bacterium]